MHAFIPHKTTIAADEQAMTYLLRHRWTWLWAVAAVALAWAPSSRATFDDLYAADKLYGTEKRTVDNRVKNGTGVIYFVRTSGWSLSPHPSAPAFSLI